MLRARERTERVHATLANTFTPHWRALSGDTIDLSNDIDAEVCERKLLKRGNSCHKKTLSLFVDWLYGDADAFDCATSIAPLMHLMRFGNKFDSMMLIEAVENCVQKIIRADIDGAVRVYR